MAKKGIAIQPLTLLAGLFLLAMAGAFISSQLKGVIFVPPASLDDATVDREYRHSFCSPDPSQPGATCGGLRPATNPSGGKPPYSFTVGYRAGLLPPGLVLNLNGILEGVPTVAGNYRFEVCAKDLATNEDCNILDLKVNKPVTLNIKFEGDGGGTFRYGATKSDDIISSDCPEGVGCTVLLKEGAEVTITAKASEDSVFAGWGGACEGTGDCIVLMDADKTVLVRLVPKTERPAGTTTPAPTTSPTPGIVETAALKIDVIGSGNGYVYLLESDDALNCDGDCNRTIGQFSDYYTSLLCLGSCTFTFKRGETADLSSYSIRGTKTVFQEWGGECSGTGRCDVLMDSDKEVTAKFTRREVVIESYTCAFRKRIGSAYEYFVSASGTASGLVGSVMKEGTLSYFEQFTCPSWTGVQQNVWPYKCGRGDGDPERTSFTVSLTFNGNKGPPFTLSKDKWLIDMVEKGGYLVTGSDNTDIVCN